MNRRDYQRYLAGHGIAWSMSRRADCYDNAVMESFFATVKKEEAERFPSYSDAKMADRSAGPFALRRRVTRVSRNLHYAMPACDY